MLIATLGSRDSADILSKTSGNMHPKAVLDTPADTLANMDAAEVCDTLVDVQGTDTPAATITQVKAKTISKLSAMWRPTERATHRAKWMPKHRATRSANRNICRRSRR